MTKATDTALLYLRIVVGGLLLFHNIGRVQNYNTIIDSYSQFDHLAAQTWFLLFGAIESIAAVMIIIGWRVRLAAVALILGTIFALSLYFPNASTTDLELNGIYVFIYIYLFISGGGLYSFDNARRARKERVQIYD